MSKGTLNKVMLIGRLGREPEMKYSPSGTAIANFSVATNYNIKGDSGDWEERTDWHNIVCFGKRAEFVGEYVKKGNRVYIEGRSQTRSWEDDNQVKHYMNEVVVNDIQLLESKSEQQESDGYEY